MFFFFFSLQCEVSHCYYQRNRSRLSSESSDEVFVEEWIIWRIVHPSSGKRERISKQLWSFFKELQFLTFVLFLQAFVRLTNQKTKQEIFFVAEPEQSKVFKFDLVSGSPCTNNVREWDNET